MSAILGSSTERVGIKTGKVKVPLTCSQEALVTSSSNSMPTEVFDKATRPLKTVFEKVRHGGVQFHQSDSSFILPPVSKHQKLSSSATIHSSKHSLSIKLIQQGLVSFNSNEFDNLNKVPASTIITGSSEKNVEKNRYPDVFPNDSTIVRTSSGGYFNGNLVKFLDEDPTAPTYIATQAPTLKTTEDFWDVVFESNTDTIVMLTNLIEQRRRKADIYWPDANQPLEQFADVAVKFLNSTNNDQGGFTIREFEITKGDVSRTIKHYHFLKWPDRGVAHVSQFNNFLGEVESSHKTGPMVVHCSAGVGRTGTFITTHKGRDLINKGATEINIFAMVNQLREERAHSVQTKEQYEFIFNSLAAFLS